MYRKFHSQSFTLAAFLLFLHTFLWDGGTEAASAAEYGQSCAKNTECSTKYCHPDKKVCDCAEWSFPSNTVVQVYHEKKKTCLSPAGSTCLTEDFLKTNPKGYKLFCVPHAKCQRDPKLGLSSRFGVCECLATHTIGVTGLCEKIEEQVQLGAIWSSGGKEGLPSASASSGGAEVPKASKYEDDKGDENSDIFVGEDKIKKIFDHKKSNGGSGMLAAAPTTYFSILYASALLFISVMHHL